MNLNLIPAFVFQAPSQRKLIVQLSLTLRAAWYKTVLLHLAKQLVAKLVWLQET